MSDRRLRVFIAVKLATAADWSSVFRTQSNASAGAALGKLPQNDISAGKSALARSTLAAAVLDRPLQPRFHRSGVRIEIATVEAQARFQAQAVARTEPDRRHLRIFENFSREGFGVPCGNTDLEAVLSRVARPKDDAIRADDRQCAHIHKAHRRDIGAQSRQHRLGERSLQREQGSIIQTFDDAAVGKRVAQVRFVRILAAGIDHKEEMIAPVRDHQVVEDAAARVGEQRISLSPFVEAQQIDRHQGLECACGALAALRADSELTHVRHIEEPCCGAGVEMLLEDAVRKIDRHLVACEGREARAELNVKVMKRGSLQPLAGGRLDV